MRPATLGSLLGTPLSKRLFSTGVLAQLDSFGRFCHADASCGGSSCLGLPGQSHDATQLSVVGFFKHVVSHQSAATMLVLLLHLNVATPACCCCGCCCCAWCSWRSCLSCCFRLASAA